MVPWHTTITILLPRHSCWGLNIVSHLVKKGQIKPLGRMLGNLANLFRGGLLSPIRGGSRKGGQKASGLTAFSWLIKKPQHPHTQNFQLCLLESVHFVPRNESEHIMTLQLNTGSRPISIISVYIPTLMDSDNVKESFYDELRTVICNIPSKQCIYILGKFNVMVGSDHASWPHQLRHHGFRVLNEKV